MTDPLPVLPKLPVLTTHISVGSFEEHVAAIVAYGAAKRSAYVCCVNAHMTVEAREPAFQRVVDQADLATADGVPVLRVMQLFHKVAQERVAGNDLLPAVFSKAAAAGVGVYLFGSSPEIQELIIARAGREIPALMISGAWSPPFAPLEQMDFATDAERINASGAGIVMVALGCPKQEKWMAAMKGKVNGIMLGVGGAFLLYAGIDKRAPKWMRDLSLEWVYRLWLEPRRLWRRYVVTNSLFLVLLVKAIVRRTLGGH